jgi:hypothetical protein
LISSRAIAGGARKRISRGGLPTSSGAISKHGGATTTIHEVESANDSTRAVTDMGQGSKKEPTGARLRTAWRKLARALTRPEPKPQPQKRRRREEGAGRHFARVGRRLTRWPACASTMHWLVDTLDWLNLWQPDAGAGDELTADYLGAPNNDLSPRL